MTIAPGLALALLPAAAIAMLLLRPIWDVDIFWQLRLGEATLRQGYPLAREPFAALHLGEPVPAIAWLGQAIMAQVRLWAGWRGLQVFDAVIWLGGFWAAGQAARLAGAGAGGRLLGMVLALVAVWPTASIRPQSFAALCFGLLLVLNRLEMPAWRRIVLTAVLVVGWQNLHPSVAVAALYLGCLAGLGWLAWLTGKAAQAPWLDTLLAAIAGLAMFATPDGFSVLATASANSAASLAIGQSEWLPLWHADNRAVVMPLALSALVSAYLVLRSRRIDWRDALPALILFAATLSAYRFVLFWAIAMVPVLARTVPKGQAERILPRWIAPLAAICAALAVGVISPARFHPSIPLAQLQALRAAGVKGTVFAHFPWGGPVIDLGFPVWRVAYDGRYYRYSLAEWDRYKAIARGETGLAEVEAAYRPAAWVLSPGWNARLINELQRDGRWRVLAQDGVAVTFVPSATVPVARGK